jgi:hypothetical protein
MMLMRLRSHFWFRCGRAALAAALLASGAGCASSAIQAAETGRTTDLRHAIIEQARRGELGAYEARQIARAVAGSEIDRAKAPDGVSRIHQFQTCARFLEDALQRRAEGSDEVAATASLVRLEAGLVEPEALAPHASIPVAAAAQSASSAAWRAAGARALVSSDAARLRRELTRDGDEQVRLAALRAARDAADPADAVAVLEAARLDPHPLARTMAIRAAGAIGGQAVVLALKDVWATADSWARQAIADAWSAPRSIDAGGRRELIWAVETQKGTPSIAAAVALIRAGGLGSAAALGTLARALESGPAQDRIFAIALAPLSAPSIRQAVTRAQKDPDESVALSALEKWIQTSPAGGGPALGSAERAAAVQRLLKVAQGSTKGARTAKAALAGAGVPEVIPMLLKELDSAVGPIRQAAGASLAIMGELPRAVILTADPEPDVRAAIACAILRN